MSSIAACGIAALCCVLLPPAPLAAQGHENMPGMGRGGMMTTPLGISMDRMGSGTTWVPDGAPIVSQHGWLHGWDIMGHGLLFTHYIAQRGPRGDRQFGSLNWVMLMASHPLAGGMLQFRTMLSLDPATVGTRGYPLLLQSGEQAHGEPLHDRQHPHDFWMELGVLYLRPLSSHTAIELYLAPSGEPALGPVAFMHRPSAVDDPIAPLGHHWQDATHISFGVATVGVFTHRWKLEGSVFNGREPDDQRWDFDFGRLDSYSGRVTYNPGKAWSLTAGAGRLQLGDAVLHRVAASVLHGTRLGRDGQWASTLVYGANGIPAGGGWSHSVLLETEAVIDQANTLFGRMEFVQKSAGDLALDQATTGLPPGRRFNLGMLSLGYIRDFARGHGLTIGVGLRGSLGFVPPQLESPYGSRHPTGAVAFVRLRPAR